MNTTKYFNIEHYENLCILQYPSFTCKFKIKGTQTNSVRLKYTKGKGHVHVENVFAYSAELHVDFAVVMLVYQLKVFDTCFINTTVKVKHKCLHLFVPLGGFIKEEHYIISVVGCELALNAVYFVFIVWPIQLFTISVHHWKQYFHSAWALGAKHVSFILNNSVLLSAVIFI